MFVGLISAVHFYGIILGVVSVLAPSKCTTWKYYIKIYEAAARKAAAEWKSEGDEEIERDRGTEGEREIHRKKTLRKYKTGNIDVGLVGKLVS